VPSALTVSSASTSGGGSCAVTANLVTCTIDPLAAGATWTVAISVAVPATASPGTVTNAATVAAVGDTDASNDTDGEPTTVGSAVGDADLSLTKAVDDPTPREDQVLAYTVVVTNAGPDVATGVEVTDPLPSGLAFVSADPSQGSYDPSSGVWTVGDLPVGASATLVLRARVQAGTAGTTITNVASVSVLDQTDPTPGDGTDPAPIDVGGASGGNGGGSGGGTGGAGGTGATTAVTGYPIDPSVFGWLASLVVLGVLALASAQGTRRRPELAMVGSGTDAPRRYLAEPFVFTADPTPEGTPAPSPAPRYLAEPFVFSADPRADGSRHA
jgi:uncharacterized repeat protein (TIGR01451 family)